MNPIDKEILKRLERDYLKRVFNGEIGKDMRRLFKSRIPLLSPFKLGYLCGVLAAKAKR